MDPKQAAKLKALRQLQEQDDGTIEPGVPVRTAPIVLPVEKPVRTAPIVLRPNAVETGGITGEIDEGAAPVEEGFTAQERNYPKGSENQEGVGLADLLAQLLGEGLGGIGGGLSKLGGAISGAKPKMTDVTPPKAVTVKEQAVTVAPVDEKSELLKKSKFNRRAFLRGIDEED